MMSKRNGGPAFPVIVGQTVYAPGMSLRDWFAEMALRGMHANPLWDDEDFYEMAVAAYQQADAMLAAREADQ